jgi:hypothetical protein
MRCTILFKDQAQEPLLPQIMPGKGAVIICASNTVCTGIKTFWYVW